jgi:hypothetical protein
MARDGDGEKKQSTSRYPLSRLSAPHDLVDVAREIQQADATLGSVTVAKLRVIAEQIRALQERAREVLDEAKHASDLHRATCNFKKRPGALYHLYRKSDGALYWSMLSPDEWGTPPDAYQGSYRLEADMTWTPLADTESRDTLDEPLRKLLTGG